MIINHSRGFVFVHVPKSAGTSVSRILEAYSSYLDLEVGGTTLGEKLQPIYKKRFHLAKHSTAMEIRAVMKPERFKSYLSIAMVRNPYTRAFSTFNWLNRQRSRGTQLSAHTIEKLGALDGSFGQFVRSEYFNSEGEDRVLRPQRFWTKIEAEQQLSFIGSVESIEEDIAKLLSLINARKLDPCAKSPTVPDSLKRNESTDKPDLLWDLLRAEPELEKLIYQRYKADFEAFGYRRIDLSSAEPYDARRMTNTVPKRKKQAA